MDDETELTDAADSDSAWEYDGPAPVSLPHRILTGFATIAIAAAIGYVIGYAFSVGASRPHG